MPISDKKLRLLLKHMGQKVTIQPSPAVTKSIEKTPTSSKKKAFVRAVADPMHPFSQKKKESTSANPKKPKNKKHHQPPKAKPVNALKEQANTPEESTPPIEPPPYVPPKPTYVHKKKDWGSTPAYNIPVVREVVPAVKTIKPLDPVRLEDKRCPGLSKTSQILLINESCSDHFPFLISDDQNGICKSFSDDPLHELTMGIDIGTSSVKVVISNLIENLYYPVNFFKARGIKAYLLPTHLSLDGNDVFVLGDGKTTFSNIKLNLLNDPNNTNHQIKFIAFVALVIRYVRAWLVSFHGEKYAKDKIDWSYRIGVPSTQFDQALLETWENILSMAALVADQKSPITSDLVFSFLSNQKDKNNNSLDTKAFPELVAETYTFIKNYPVEHNCHYLLADIGSGTLDVALLRLFTLKISNKANYEIYTESVTLHGTLNCHLKRLKTIKDALSFCSESDCSKDCRSESARLTALIDQQLELSLQTAIPYSINDYCADVRIALRRESGPDEAFFKEVFEAINSVRIDGWKKNKLSQDEINLKTPIFVAGGGARSKRYLEAIKGLGFEDYHSNATWLRKPKVKRFLPIKDLISLTKIASADLDRLSVAYGLSSCDPELFITPDRKRNEATCPPVEIISKDQV